MASPEFIRPIRTERGENISDKVLAIDQGSTTATQPKDDWTTQTDVFPPGTPIEYGSLFILRGGTMAIEYLSHGGYLAQRLTPEGDTLPGGVSGEAIVDPVSGELRISYPVPKSWPVEDYTVKTEDK